jgi:hypothetical protein
MAMKTPEREHNHSYGGIQEIRGSADRKGGAKMKKMVLIGTVLGVIVGCVTTTSTSTFTPLPSSVEIIQPSPGLPKEIAGFFGTWHGIWDNGHKVTLVVEKIELPTATVIYSWGEYKGKQGEWSRDKWKIEPNKLEEELKFVTITYFLSRDGKSLEGTYVRSDEQGRVKQINYTTMQRGIPEPLPTVSNPTPLPPFPRITPPSPDLPKEIAGFSGTWYGIWDYGQKVTLIVEKIEPPTATIIYSLGEVKGGEPGWGRSEWKIGSNKLENDSIHGISVTFSLSGDGKSLEAMYTRKDEHGTATQIDYATMQRGIPEPLPTVSNPTPLPLLVRITPPSPDLPKEIAGFSGTWHGTWDNGRKTTLVVEKIQPPTAIAIYSWGEYKGFFSEKEGWRRWEWTVKPGILELKSTGGLEITYVLLPNGELKGTWKKGSTKLEGIMRKQ